MTLPRRVQWRARQRDWRKPDGVVYVGRPTRWANPFDWRKYGRAEAVKRFRLWIETQPDLIEAARRG